MTPENPNPAADEPPDTADVELVAYLDGELDGPEAQAVESQLALDPTIRAKADSYKKTFDLLDYLPKPEPSPDFTNRTLTRLQPALTASEPVSASGSQVTPGSATGFPASQSASSRSTGRWLLTRGILAVVAVWVGIAAQFGFRAAVGPPAIHADSLPLSDLRVIERLPLYLGVENLAFLRALEESELFSSPAISRSSARGDDPLNRPERVASDRDALIRLFMSYPSSRRLQLRQLDEELSALPVNEQQRLTPILEGYAVWLDRLPDAEREAVLAAPDSDSRLTTIRRTREKQWRESLPTRQRELLKLTADPEETVRLITAWKEAEQARVTEWELARRQWDELNRGPKSRPWPFGEPRLSREIDEYIQQVFKADLSQKTEGKFDLPASCRLDRGEFLELKNRQEAAKKEGYWLLYGACLLRLAERHPYLPPPVQEKPFTELQQVPKELLKEIRVRRNIPELGRMRGKWPEFALELHEAAARAKATIPVPLGPARVTEFAPPLREFVNQTLTPVLTPEEAQSLHALEGRWPEYPRRLLELARKQDLPVPGVTLPGAPNRWHNLYGSPDLRK